MNTKVRAVRAAPPKSSSNTVPSPQRAAQNRGLSTRVRGRQKKRDVQKLLLDIPPPPQFVARGRQRRPCGADRLGARNKALRAGPEAPKAPGSCLCPGGGRCHSRPLQPTACTRAAGNLHRRGRSRRAVSGSPRSAALLHPAPNSAEPPAAAATAASPPERPHRNSRAGRAAASPARPEGPDRRRFGDIPQKSGAAATRFRFRE